jgi:hypothetical protein
VTSTARPFSGEPARSGSPFFFDKHQGATMLIRLAGAIAIALLVPFVTQAAPLPKDPPKGMPHLVVQFKSFDGIMDDLKHVRDKLQDLPDQQPIFDVNQLVEFLDSILPEWRHGLDLSKPFGGYLTLQPVLEKSRPVLLIPIKEEKAALKTLSIVILGAEETEDGIYKGSFKFLFGAGIDTYFRFKNGYAYITTEDASAIKNADKLPNPADLMLKEETALIAARLYIEGAPSEVKKTAREFLDGLGNHAGVGLSEMLFMALMGASDTKDFAARLRRVVDEAKWASLRLEFDRKNDELALEFNLVPVKETPLAKEIAAFVPHKSRMAGLLGKETAAGALLSYGNFGGLKLTPEAIDEFLNDLLKDVGLDGADKARAVLAKALIESIKVDQADIAIALKKASGAKTYTVVLGAKLQKSQALGLALFAYLQSLPKEKRERFTRAAVKLEGGVEVHKISFPDFPDDARKLLGEAEMYFFLKDNSLFAAIGAGAIDRLQECLKLEPKDGPQFLVEVTPSSLTQFVESNANEQIARRWAKTFAKNDKVRVLSGRVDGGPILRVRYSSDFVSVLKMFFVRTQ